MKINYLILLVLEIETFVRNPAGIRSNGRLGNKGREKMKILEKL